MSEIETSLERIKKRLERVSSESFTKSKLEETIETMDILMKNPLIREKTKEIVREREQEEQEHRDYHIEEISIKVDELEKKVTQVQRNLTIFLNRQSSIIGKNQEMEKSVNELKEKISNLEIHQRTEIGFYNNLRGLFNQIDEIKLMYIQKLEVIIYITIFYDGNVEDYSEIETRIFNTYNIIIETFSEIESEILVMVYDESISPPEDAYIILRK